MFLIFALTCFSLYNLKARSLSFHENSISVRSSVKFRYLCTEMKPELNLRDKNDNQYIWYMYVISLMKHDNASQPSTCITASIYERQRSETKHYLNGHKLAKKPQEKQRNTHLKYGRFIFIYTPSYFSGLIIDPISQILMFDCCKTSVLLLHVYERSFCELGLPVVLLKLLRKNSELFHKSHISCMNINHMLPV